MKGTASPSSRNWIQHDTPLPYELGHPKKIILRIFLNNFLCSQISCTFLKFQGEKKQLKISVADPDSNSGARIRIQKKIRIRVLKKQNFDLNVQKIIPKYFVK